MQAAFEMNLDTSTSPEAESKTMESESKNFFKIFASPKFARKTPSPLLSSSSSNNNSKKLESPTTSATTLTTPKIPQKTLLGSPRLHRAIFGSSRDKRKKLDSAQVAIAEEANDFNSSASSFNSNHSSDTSMHCSPPAQLPTGRSQALQRPPPLISPISPTFISDDVSSCPGTPKTPLKPAMGVAMIGKQRRTPPVNADCASFSPPPQSPSIRTPRSYATHFTYTLTPKLPANQVSPAELEYPPVFEPGSYSLSEKNVEMHLSRSSAVVPPVPAPRTKFLTSVHRVDCHRLEMNQNNRPES